MQTWMFVSEIVRNAGLAIAAFGGLILAWWKLAPERTQAYLARRAHVAELFNPAAGQRVDERLEVRLGAIYLLREVGRDFPTSPIRSSSFYRPTFVNGAEIMEMPNRLSMSRRS